MSYDEKFFALYSEYLKEPTVGAAHDWVFKIAGLNPAFKKVLDLGCGMCREWFQHGPICDYYGVDTVLPETAPTVAHYQVVRRNYRVDRIDDIFPEATAFVSLFSSEITDKPSFNTNLYNYLFWNRPALKAGLVSGFYYTDMRLQNPVRETGGIWSYQTLGNIEDEPLAPSIRERRIIMPVPSRMFGPKVVEVWRLFERQSPEDGAKQ